MCRRGRIKCIWDWMSAYGSARLWTTARRQRRTSWKLSPCVWLQDLCLAVWLRKQEGSSSFPGCHHALTDDLTAEQVLFLPGPCVPRMGSCPLLGRGSHRGRACGHDQLYSFQMEGRFFRLDSVREEMVSSLFPFTLSLPLSSLAWFYSPVLWGLCPPGWPGRQAPAEADLAQALLVLIHLEGMLCSQLGVGI